MEKSIDEQIQELIEDINKCQEIVRDESLDQKTRDAARKKIQDDWYEISQLRKINKQEDENNGGN